jgi:protein pelota
MLTEIAKCGLAEYGAAEVKKLLDAGAVVRLLITDELVRNGEAEALLEAAKRTNADYAIVSTSHEAGKKLKGMGGVGALLRFKLNQ